MSARPTLPESVIASVFPSQTLRDVVPESHNDLENDLDQLLHWLQPSHDTDIDMAQAEPSPRTKVAAKRCLRTQSQQLGFMKLWINSIQVDLAKRFPRDSDLFTALDIVWKLRSYYTKQLNHLKLSTLANDVFLRGLFAIFARYLQQPHYLRQLEQHIRDRLFEGPSVQLKTLASINMDSTLREIVVNVTVEKICTHLRSACLGQWNTPVLHELEKWLRLELYPSFSLGCGSRYACASSNDLVQIARDELVSLRIKEVYDMVTSYPSSIVALQELRECLALDSDQLHSLAHHRSKIVSVFIDNCNQRLLHSGTNTTDVIITYTKTIKAFLLIDPTGVLLDKVVRPMRQYLATRPDLVQQVVNGMLETDPLKNPLIELAQTLQGNEPPVAAPIDDLTDLQWNPDPIDALPDFRKGEVSDVLEALISIFDSPTVFIERLTEIFGDRLLKWDQYSLEQVEEYTDLLKARFGANEFSSLDVMIRDVQLSNKINSQLNTSGMELTILSRMYWPSIAQKVASEPVFTIPVQSKFEQYTENYQDVKPGRALSLFPSLGLVSLDLEFDGEFRSFNVTPAQATVIEVFDEEHDALSLGTIVLSTGLTEYAATQALKHWVDESVLVLENGTYKVKE